MGWLWRAGFCQIFTESESGKGGEQADGEGGREVEGGSGGGVCIVERGCVGHECGHGGECAAEANGESELTGVCGGAGGRQAGECSQ